MESEVEEFIIGAHDENEIEIIDIDPPMDEVLPTSRNDASKPVNCDTTSDRSKVINYMLKQQEGQFRGNINLSSMKASQLDPRRYFLTTHNELHIKECKYIKPGLDGESVVGLWHGNQYDNILYRLQVKLDSSCTTKEEDAPKTITSIERQGPYFAQTHIADLSDTYIRDQSYILYVGRNFGNRTSMSGSVVCTFLSTSPTNGKQFMSSKKLTCCAGCKSDNMFAIGTTEGIFITRDDSPPFFEDYSENNNINSVEFNLDGNLIYCGVDSAHLLAYDLREGSPSCFKHSIEGLSTVGITYTKVLSNENEVIVSCKDGSMGKFDLRSRNFTTNYAGQVALPNRSPFTVSESADLLCATGSDNMTRVWSLSTGELWHSIKPRMLYEKAHSILVSRGLRWAVAMFQKNRMYVVEPWA